MKLPIEFYDPNALAVSKVYPFAYRCSDRDGFYIVSGTELREELGKGRTPEKAWKNAADRMKKDIPRPKIPRKRKK